MKIGLVHPGEMGAAVGGLLVSAGHDVAWASRGRSEATAARAAAVGLRDAGTVDALGSSVELVLSICPPHAALDVAGALAGFSGIYVDANAIAPATTRAVAGALPAARFVDGGIIGPPPVKPGRSVLYLSGTGADHVAGLFDGTVLAASVIGDRVGAASALKLAYASWTKASKALLLAARAVAAAEGVEDHLLAEWERSLVDMTSAVDGAARSAVEKGWRWAGEMDEIAAMMAANGLPDGFHRAAAELYRRAPRHAPDGHLVEALVGSLSASAAPRPR